MTGGGRRPAPGGVAVAVATAVAVAVASAADVSGGAVAVVAPSPPSPSPASSPSPSPSPSASSVGYREKGVFSGLRGLLSRMVRHAARGGCPAGAGWMADTGWRVMWLAARLMPPAEGRRWLAEAESFLAEAPPALRRGAIGSYLTSTPQVITVSWAGVLTQRARRALRGRAAPR